MNYMGIPLWSIWKSQYSRSRRTRKSAAARSIFAHIDILEPRTLLSVFTVTNLHDSGAGSLRAAVASANSNPGADVIAFQNRLAGTITLTTGQLEISDALTINGPGVSRLSISGNNATRLFQIDQGTSASISNLTLTNARNTVQEDVGIVVTRGGAILNDGGVLNVDHVTFRNNTTIDPTVGTGASQVVGGGAIVNSSNARLTVQNSLFIGNTASGGTSYAFGGAIANVTNSDATILNSTFIGNVATNGGTSYGGAIGNFGSSRLTVSGSSFLNNSAKGSEPGEAAFGGAIATRPGTVVDSGSTTSIDKSTFVGNSAIGASGGTNQPGADAGGGALYNLESTLNVTQSWFIANSAIGGVGSTNGNAFGGAIDSSSIRDFGTPVTNITGSHFSANRALAGNRRTASGGLAAGGALYNGAGQLKLAQTRLVGNVANANRGGQGIGGGLYNLDSLTTDRATVMCNSASTSNPNVYNSPSTTVT
jgi:hypothetical protein